MANRKYVDLGTVYQKVRDDNSKLHYLKFNTGDYKTQIKKVVIETNEGEKLEITGDNNFIVLEDPEVKLGKTIKDEGKRIETLNKIKEANRVSKFVTLSIKE